jgi:cbb3-type cytochrome oxidase subunit 3
MNPDGSSPDLSMLIAITLILVLYFVFMFLTKGKKERVK